jgi:hypothetical protein
VRFIVISFFIFLCFKTKAQIINIEDKRIRGTKDSVHWYGHINFGASLNKIRETVLQLQTDMQLEYRWKKNIVLSLSNYRLVQAGNKAFVNAGFQHLRYNYKIKNHFTWEAFGQIQQNQIQLIRLRSLLGTGLRYRLFRKHEGKTRAYLGLAFMYEHNDFKNNQSVDYERLSNYFSLTFRPKKTFLFQHTTYMQPALWHFDQWRWSSESDVEFSLNTHLSFRVAFDMSYDATLPPDIPRYTYNWSNGLKWVF